MVILNTKRSQQRIWPGLEGGPNNIIPNIIFAYLSDLEANQVSVNFGNLTKREGLPINSPEEFDRRISEGLAKIDGQLSLSEDKLKKRMRSEKKMEWKLGLRE